MKQILLFILLAFLPLTLSAQTTEERHRAIYDAAEQDYNIGRLEEAEKQLKDNIDNFPVALRQNVYRMLSLCYLGMDREDEAEQYVRNMLDENPYYSPTLNDPQRFIDMVENFKSGLSATITTASSQAENLSEVPVPTTLITEEMIHDCSARNLQEVLAAYVPGMNIVDCNDDINIAMRGIYSVGQEKILIMLNGHRLNSFATNIAAPDFSISLDKVRQIEVLRGPASSLYGGVSLTAVVNVITKQGADVDGVEAHAGVGSHGQLKAGLLFGKRYFDLDLIIWGNLYKASGEKIYVPQEETGMKMTDGDITVGKIGPKPSYDIGLQMKYKNLQFLYNSAFSQIVSPFTMGYTMSPYTIDNYRTVNSIRPSFSTLSHHANLSYGQQLGNLYLKGTVTYDNSDLTHYQVVNEPPVSAFIELLPLPDIIKNQLSGHEGITRFLNGQEHTIGGKLQGDWSYINTTNHQGQLSFGAEYSYFELDDVRYTYGYDYNKLASELDSIQTLGKGHESNFNAFVQLKHHWRSFIFNTGLRFDYKNRYNGTKIREFSPRMALIYVQPKWNLKLSYSKAFIDAPYMYRKINLFLYSYMGYPELTVDLAPESLHSLQLTFGANHWLPGLNFEINGFYNRARDLIIPNVSEHENTGNINTYGIELSANYQYRRFSSYLTATWQDVGREEIYDYDIKQAISTPTISANAVLAWQVTKSLNLHTHIDFQGRQQAFYLDIINYAAYYSILSYLRDLILKYEARPTNDLQHEIDVILGTLENPRQKMSVTKDVPARVLFDVGATYKWRNFTFEFNVKNLFNKNYRQGGLSTGLVPQRGRWMMFDVAYKF
jgi:iron complex outermembrane receptor protein